MGHTLSEHGAAAIRRWAALVTARPGILLAIASLMAALAVWLGHDAARYLDSEVKGAPGAESTIGADLLEKNFPASQRNLSVLVTAAGSIDDDASVRAGRSLTAGLKQLRGVNDVVSYWDSGAPGLKSANGRSALLAAHLTGTRAQAGRTLDSLRARLQERRGHLHLQFGGTVAVGQETQRTVQHDLSRAEAVALPVVLVLSLVVFESIAAAALPFVVAVIAVTGTDALLRALARVIDVSVFAVNLAMALGVGLAVDYSLLLVRRYREEARSALTRRQAVVTAMGSAGRTIVFSAAILAVALTTLLLFPLPFLRSMAYAGLGTVVLATTATVVVLPALLAVLGDRIEWANVRRFLRRKRRRSARHAARPAAGEVWARAARWSGDHAWTVTLTTVTGLVLLGTPFLHARFDTSDVRQLPVHSPVRQAEEHLGAVFPTTSVEIVLRPADHQGTAAYARLLSRLPSVGAVDGPDGRYVHGRRSGPQQPARRARAGSWLSVAVTPTASSDRMSGLVRQIRRQPAPSQRYVTGVAAVGVDTKDTITAVLPYAAAAVVLTTLLLVLLLTGRLLLAAQSVLFNATSLAFMFGAQVWAFQDGHLAQALHFTTTGSLDIGVSVLMGLLAFGLSMDYGVFLIARIAEETRRCPDTAVAVAQAARSTGGTITAAACMLAASMAALAGSRITSVKMLGLGVALAVLADAMVIRTLLLPAVLSLTGRQWGRARRPEAMPLPRLRPSVKTR